MERGNITVVTVKWEWLAENIPYCYIHHASMKQVEALRVSFPDNPKWLQEMHAWAAK